MAIETVLYISQQTHVSIVLAKSGTEVPYQFPVAWLTLCESEVLLIYYQSILCDSEVAHNIPVDGD